MRLPSFFFLTAGLLLALTFQVSVLSQLSLPGAEPDLLLVCVAAVAFAWGDRTGMLAGFLIGLAADLVPPAAHAFGLQAFVLCLAGFLAGRASGFVRGSALRPMLLIAGFAAATPVLYALLGLAVGHAVLPWSQMGSAAAAAALYAAVMAPFIVPLALSSARRAERRGPLPTQRVQSRAGAIRPLGRNEKASATQVIQ